MAIPRPMLFTLRLIAPDWPTLIDATTDSEAFYSGIDYICSTLIGIPRLPLLNYTDATMHSFAKTIDRLKSRAYASAPHATKWVCPGFKAFHQGALATLGLINMEEFGKGVREGVVKIAAWLEASVHHEFVRLVEIWECGERTDEEGKKRLREVREVARMKCVLFVA